MSRLVLFLSLLPGLLLNIAIAQEPYPAVLISGQTLVPVGTDSTPGPSTDSGYQAFYVPEGNCIAVLATGDLNLNGGIARGEGLMISDFNLFLGAESSPGTQGLEEISSCGPYFDDRRRLYAGALSDQTSAGGYTKLTIERAGEPQGDGQLVDTNNDGVFDALRGTMSDGSPLALSVLVDLMFYPDADNPTHLVIPGSNRSFSGNTYIPMNPDGSITAVNASNNAALGGVCLTVGVTVRALPVCRPPAPAVGIPLLSRWGMAGLMLVLLGVTVVGMRRFQV